MTTSSSKKKHSAQSEKKDNSDFNFGLLQEQRRNLKYCDFAIHSIYGDSKKIFQCHKIVVTSASPYFRNELEKEDRDFVVLTSIDHETVEGLIEYMYSSGVVNLTQTNVITIYAAAKTLELTVLQRKCLDLMPNLVPPQEIVKVLRIMREHQRVDLMEKCFRVFLKNIKIIKAHGIDDLDFESLKEIVDYRNKSELVTPEEMLTVVVQWLEKINKYEQKEYSDSLIKAISLKEVDVDRLKKIFSDHSFLLKIRKVLTLYCSAMEEIALNAVQKNKRKSEAGTSSKSTQPGPGPSKRSRSVSGSSNKSSLTRTDSQNSDTDLIYFVSSHGSAKRLHSFHIKSKRELVLGEIPKSLKEYHPIYENGKVYCFPNKELSLQQRPTNCLKIFDIKEKTWVIRVLYPPHEYRFGNIVRLKNSLYIVGGLSVKGDVIPEARRFHFLFPEVAPRTHFISRSYCKKVGFSNLEWNQLHGVTAMTTPRNKFGIGVIDGRIYAVGGYSPKDDKKNFSVLNSLECYYPDWNCWKSKAVMPTRRMGPAVAVIESKLYVMGGLCNYDETYKECWLSSVDVYNSISDRWYSSVPMVKKRYRFSTVVINGCIYALGGDFNGKPTFERLDAGQQKWELMGDLPSEGSFENVALHKQE